MVNLNRLHYFFICAQFKQVTRAAEFLGISQPSLSQQLSLFEDELGFDLFVRSGRAIELTPKGKLLFEKSIELFKNAEAILSFVEARDEVTRPYRVLVSDQIDRPFVAELVGKLFKNSFTANRYFEVISKAQDLMEELYEQDHFDLFITNEKLKRLKPFDVFHLPVHLVTSKSQMDLRSFSERNLKGILSFLGEQLVLPSVDLQLRGEIDSFLKQEEIKVPVIFESNIIACVVRAIKEGVGCGFIPRPYINYDLKRNQISVIGPPGGFWEHSLYFYSGKKEREYDNLIPSKIAQIMRSYSS